MATLVIEYRKRGEECRALARRAVLEEHRKTMVDMALMWEQMADQREAYLKNHPDMTDPIALAWRGPNSN